MTLGYRKYQRSDYHYCEAMVNQAWGFDNVFSSKNLQKIAKTLYTKGAEASSNYKFVATCEGRVVGFIFGFNAVKRTPKWGFLLALKATFDLNVKKMDKSERQQFIEALTQHQKNRAQVDPIKSNEIVLFVVNNDYQGKGIGKELWQGFRQFCENAGQTKICVETNMAGASGFYETLGFTHQVNFNSPLHNLATPNGQACIYEYSLRTRK